MKKSPLKKRYLIQNPKEAVRTFATAFPSYLKLFLGLYLETDVSKKEPLGVLSLRFDVPETLLLFERVCTSYILEEVSHKKEYKNRFLALFGLPCSYDFSLLDVFKRCDTLGATPFEFSFLGGMSSQKVLRVLLYRQMQFLEHTVALLLDDDAKAPKKLFHIANEIQEILALGEAFFDACLLQRFKEACVPFLSKQREQLLLCVQQEAYQTFCMDMDFFLREQSGFYCLERGDTPLLFLLKKKPKKENRAIIKRLRKALS
ncbi:hypothetical protein [Sulfurospirillum barnesii]|uniref:Uncharacterized protein n=1 Tax=Sulfurospirillum barnesii (strain ATCC 700032 / DSM 10660 / SES-3) TaxID=760154 RepID=I3XUJ6_SULBS|nr:hypothetical protein [Sulfurospirillum barnesii]AFL67620.1 hypothetical protein Sulba_0294 [Sulfurospirillum barnesii SES-3]